MYKSIVAVLLTAITLPMAGFSSLANLPAQQGSQVPPVVEPETCSDACSDRGSGRRDRPHSQSSSKERGSGRIDPDVKDAK